MGDKEIINSIINSDNIPQELKAIPQWVCWKYIQIPRRKTAQKVPYNPVTMKPAGSNDHKTWGIYEDAERRFSDNEADGIGFEFCNNGIVGIDLDGVRDPVSGTVETWALDVIAMTDYSYTEISPSGTGLHILTKSPLIVNRNAKPVEMYSRDHFITMTGNVYDGYDMIKDCPNGVQAIYDKFFANKKRTSENPHVVSYPKMFDNETIIKMALAARNCFRFHDLFAGEWEKYEEYGSQSEADSALCYMLAFWTGRNSGQMDEIFRISALMRDKWDEVHYSCGETYGEHTIKEAVEKCREVYYMYESVKPSDYTDSGNAEVFAGNIIAKQYSSKL